MLKSLIDLMRFLVAFPFFAYASYQDFRERLIDNRIWFYLGIIAVIFDVVYFSELGWMLVFLIPSIIMFYEWFFDWNSPWIPLTLYLIAFVILIYPLLTPALLNEVYPLLLIALLMLFVRILHATKIIRGKADARALMLISLLQPLYPHFYSFPLFIPKYVGFVQVAFPFLFVVLLYASFVAFGYIIFLFLLNVVRGDFGFPEMFIGYRVNVDDVSKKHVWLMERIENGEPVLYIHPDEHTEEDIEKLKRFGEERVWVQPQIPFIIFITIGLILAYLIGNFL